MPELAGETHEYLTVRELAELLRIKERKVYDLASSGAVPCSRATGKLLFPASEIRDWIENAKSGGKREMIDRPDIFLGSHDPLLDWAIRQSRCGLATYFDGSLDGLARFRTHGGVATGLHVFDAGTSSWNVTEARRAAEGQDAALIGFASRSRGLVLRPDGPKPASISELAGLRVAPRQKEAGTAGLFRDIAKQQGLSLSDIHFTDVARTEDDAVQMVRHGDADATFGLQSVAETYGMDFVPIVEECFDLLVDRKAWFDPPLQTLFDFCRSETFLRRAASYGGYDLSRFGQVVWNS